LKTVIFNNGMTCDPVLKYTTIRQTYDAYQWFEKSFHEIKQCFDRTNSYARLTNIKRNLAGFYYLFVLLQQLMILWSKYVIVRC
jgi:hydroxymethylglutaryl-CoA reductase